jgi:uncharacterized protein DUF4258
MTAPIEPPRDPLTFIKECMEGRQIFWTYHVNMRLRRRSITREVILNAIDSFEVIEEYPDDKYLPSYLIRAESNGLVFHVHVATDMNTGNIKVVTVYIPDFSEWEESFRIRRRG